MLASLLLPICIILTRIRLSSHPNPNLYFCFLIYFLLFMSLSRASTVSWSRVRVLFVQLLTTTTTVAAARSGVSIALPLVVSAILMRRIIALTQAQRQTELMPIIRSLRGSPTHLLYVYDVFTDLS